MGLVTQYSRIAHHTIFGLTGSTFSIPASEDFTDGSWTIYDLALSEIGVNETDEKAYIRIGNSIKEFNFGTGSGGGGGTVSVSASNGLSISGGDVILGGTLSQNTVIAGNSYSVTFGDIISPSRIKGFGVETYDGIFIRDDDSFNLSVLDMSASGGGSILSAAEQITGAGGEFSAGAYGKAHMRATTGADFFKIELDAESPSDKKMVVTDTISSRGLQYAANYTAQFVTHSLVSKGYVDSKTYSLLDTLAVNNDAGTYSIRMGTGLIESSGNLSNLNLTDNEVIITTPKLFQANGISSSPVIYENTQVTTTTASTITLFTFPNTDLSADAAISFDAIVNGFCPVTGESYFGKIFAGFNNVSSTMTQIGITNITEISSFTSSVTSDMLTNGTDVLVEVTGESGKTINWTIRTNYQFTY